MNTEEQEYQEFKDFLGGWIKPFVVTITIGLPLAFLAGFIIMILAKIFI